MTEEDIPAYTEKIEDPWTKVFIEQTESYRNGYYRVMPYNMIFPESYLQFDQRIRHFQIQDDDVWVATAIKCGKWVPFTRFF